jgi:Uma2 family endonuclease
MPELKHTELIEGVVYLGGPVSRRHGSHGMLLSAWLSYYAFAGREDFEIDSNTSWLIGESAFQPDVALLRPASSGDPDTKYLERVPDLVVEVSYSSRSYDLGPKLAAYRSAGLREYITVLLEEQRVEWRVLNGTRYRLLHPAKDGILRSPHFRGLWLDTKALFPPDRQRLFGAIDRGLGA